ncbi:MAG: hypothetical protein R3181_15995, partial [Rubricoccaceae bacterium]|nr:hypothetical protein [Rubricoccaceae bacterium]
VLPNPVQAGARGAVEVVLGVEAAVRVEAFDALGRRLALLHDGPLAAGPHRLRLPPGPPGLVVVRATGPFGSASARAIRR